MRHLHMPIEQLAPSALVDGAITTPWAGALNKALGQQLKAESELTFTYVQTIVKTIASRPSL